ncbi:MAG: sulfatase-like hydrolase/transferase, partial [Verrucomicrobiae bacterium]|nr:sulfatase-like hydrolase/transferase [Verrucomicrobiae bacterium]
TPNIDRLAAGGVHFQNSFVEHSICWVSRTTILTGLTARSFGERDRPDFAKPEALTALYPDRLRQAGYRVGFYGKWHAKMPPNFKPADHYDAFEAIGRNPYFKKQPDGSLRHETDLIGDRAVAFLDSQPAGQPFMLNLWFNAAHAEDGDKRPGIGHYPWPPGTDGLYEDIVVPPPRLNAPAIFENQPEFLKKSINRERFFWRWDTPEKYQTNIRAYFRMLSGIDAVVGRIVAELEKRGLAENTVIVYMADNGYYMGDRGFAGKWSHYEQSLRVPLVVYDPRLPAEKRGRKESRMALNLDLSPTFLDWAGVAIPESYQGHSLRPVVEGAETPDWRTDFFCEHVTLAPQITWEGVHGERYQYARYIDQGNYEFLFDLESDPDELKNLAGDPAAAEVLAKMRVRCDELVAQYGGPLLPLAERKVKAMKDFDEKARAAK